MTALARRDQGAEITRLKMLLDEEAETIVRDAYAAADIDDDDQELVTNERGKVIGVHRIPPEKPEGWSQKKFRIARDARKSTAEAPVYLKMASRRLEAKESAAPPPIGNLNILINLPPPETPEEHAAMPAIDVKVEVLK